MPLGMEVGLCPGDFVLDGDPASYPKRDPATPRKKGTQILPNFWPMSIVVRWLDEDAALYRSRPRPRPLCSRRDPSSRERGTAAPSFWPMSLWPRSPISTTAELVFFFPRLISQFSAHVYCGQTAGWTKMALGMEVGLGPVHIVLDRDTAPFPKRGQSLPQFSAHLYCGQRLDASRCHLVWR